jgi:hypothetical protein
MENDSGIKVEVRLLPAYSSNGTSIGASTLTGSITVRNAQLEQMSGTQTLPSDYVNTDVESTPFHGAMVDGVKYFDTDRSGVPIPEATLKGLMLEGEGENLALWSQDFSKTAVWIKDGTGTQTIKTLSDTDSGAITYYYNDEVLKNSFETTLKQKIKEQLELPKSLVKVDTSKSTAEASASSSSAKRTSKRKRNNTPSQGGRQTRKNKNKNNNKGKCKLIKKSTKKHTKKKLRKKLRKTRRVSK